MSSNGDVKKVKAIYAVLATPPGTGEEGIIIAKDLIQGEVPLVGSKLESFEKFREQVVCIARANHIKVRIAKFTVREDIETIE